MTGIKPNKKFPYLDEEKQKNRSNCKKLGYSRYKVRLH